MRIVIYHAHPATAQRWQALLAQELRDATVWAWQPGDTRQADYAVGWAPSREFLDGQSHLQAFFSMGAGVERLLREPALAPTLPIIRLEDAGMAPQMADYCVHAVLRWMRHHEEYARLQRARQWQPLPPEDIDAWPIGLFGLGVLGTHVASVLSAHGFRVHAYVRTPRSEVKVRVYAGTNDGDFAAFLQASRVLVLLAPLTEQTRDLFDRRSLALLPRGAFVINVARGGLIVDEALIELLDSGHLAGAALDVFREEPLPAEHPFWNHPKITLTPHVSAVTLIEPSARQVAEKIRRLTRGESVSGVVGRERGY